LPLKQQLGGVKGIDDLSESHNQQLKDNIHMCRQRSVLSSKAFQDGAYRALVAGNAFVEQVRVKEDNGDEKLRDGLFLTWEWNMIDTCVTVGRLW
jgi:hypothetical protein